MSPEHWSTGTRLQATTAAHNKLQACVMWRRMCRHVQSHKCVSITLLRVALHKTVDFALWAVCWCMQDKVAADAVIDQVLNNTECGILLRPTCGREGVGAEAGMRRSVTTNDALITPLRLPRRRAL